MKSLLYLELLGTHDYSTGTGKDFSTVIGLTIRKEDVLVGSRVNRESRPLDVTMPDVIINEPGVSRNHAHIFHADGNWYVEDYGSGNGTWIMGGDPLTLEKLDDVDRVRIRNNLILAKEGNPVQIVHHADVLFGVAVARLTVVQGAAE